MTLSFVACGTLTEQRLNRMTLDGMRALPKKLHSCFPRKVEMHRFAATILAMVLMAGCSAHSRDPSTLPTIDARPSDISSSSDPAPFKAPPLADLTEDVKGKILVHHIDDKAEFTDWSQEVKLGSSYSISVDCIGAEGDIVIRIDDSLMSRPCLNRQNIHSTLASDQCSGGPNPDLIAILKQCSRRPAVTEFSVYPGKKAHIRHVVAKVPSGAKWALLISSLRRN
ncbi:hypothetical protein SAMN05216276_101858 [Streptosporangium subroseum]|uniref:Uncharacterized protein n=1 Tax=Streptosporangium subroseum TaxID=106412 RepID=A0A239I0R5_9ACTN|nr:hypothetical protein [Streptosporangium subroseum]SNS87240.1 hypothetical protein SAMN05216276_101858 [Streptosporangium subroseum]